MQAGTGKGQRGRVGQETRAPDCQHPHLCATIWFISNRITFVHTGSHTQGHLVVFIGWLLLLVLLMLLLVLSPLTHGWHPQSMRLFGHLPPWGLSLSLSLSPFCLDGSEPFSGILIQFGSPQTHAPTFVIIVYVVCGHIWPGIMGLGGPAAWHKFPLPFHHTSGIRIGDCLAETHNQVLILNVYGYFIAAIRVIRPRSGSCRICYCSLLSGSLR